MRFDESQVDAVDIVDRLIEGDFLTTDRVDEVRRRFPEVFEWIMQWISDSASANDWRRVERLANLAASLQVSGLGDVLCEILSADPTGLNKEDLIEILGEIRAASCASQIFQTAKNSLASDAPAYWLCQKAILALSDLDTAESRHFLFSMTQGAWPNPIRWHAAVALNIEDELGFDEDEMLGELS